MSDQGLRSGRPGDGHDGPGPVPAARAGQSAGRPVPGDGAKKGRPAGPSATSPAGGQHTPPAAGGKAKGDGAPGAHEAATAAAAAPSEVDPALGIAIHLGWRMAELYSESTTVVGSAADADALPGLSRLGQRQTILLRLREVAADVGNLGAGPLHPADLASATKVIADQLTTWAPPAPGDAEPAVAPEALATLHQVVHSVHCDLLSALSAAHRQVGIAYGMGRATADLYLRPATTKDEALADLRGRVPRIQQWLRNLKSSLPPHAAEGVSQSMAAWHTWVEGADASEWDQPAPWHDPLHPSTSSSAVSWALSEQAAAWRQVLTGETVATDLLSADDLAQAGNGMLQRVYKLGTQFWARYWPILVPTVVGLAAVVVGVSLAAGGAGAIASSLAALAGVFGITWKGTRATVGSVLQRAEGPLWGAELDMAVAKAVTALPHGAQVHVDVPPSGLAQALLPRRAVPSPTLAQGSA